MKKAGFQREYGWGLILTVVVAGLSISALPATANRTIQAEESARIFTMELLLLPRI